MKELPIKEIERYERKYIKMMVSDPLYGEVPYNFKKFIRLTFIEGKSPIEALFLAEDRVYPKTRETQLKYFNYTEEELTESERKEIAAIYTYYLLSRYLGIPDEYLEYIDWKYDFDYEGDIKSQLASPEIRRKLLEAGAPEEIIAELTARAEIEKKEYGVPEFIVETEERMREAERDVEKAVQESVGVPPGEILLTPTEEGKYPVLPPEEEEWRKIIEGRILATIDTANLNDIINLTDNILRFIRDHKVKPGYRDFLQGIIARIALLRDKVRELIEKFTIRIGEGEEHSVIELQELLRDLMTNIRENIVFRILEMIREIKDLLKVKKVPEPSRAGAETLLNELEDAVMDVKIIYEKIADAWEKG